MADLLSATDRAEIASAIEDVIDTFFQKTITLQQYRTNTIKAFNEGVGQSATQIDLPGLFVPDNTDLDAEATRRPQGTSDHSEGVVYFGYADLVTAGLIQGSGEVNIIPNKDILQIDGQDRDIIGVNLVGPKEDTGTFFLLKVHYSKILEKEKPVS